MILKVGVSHGNFRNDAEILEWELPAETCVKTPSRTVFYSSFGVELIPTQTQARKESRQAFKVKIFELKAYSIKLDGVAQFGE